MCCRYCFEDQAKNFIRHMAVNGFEPETAALEMVKPEVRPNDKAWLLTGQNGQIRADCMRWGFMASGSGQLVINARSETVFEKPMFSASIRSRRCVIACDCFYEWDREKEMCTFTRPDASVILLAGIYDYIRNEKRFTVLTTEANNSVLPVHDRMPLILEPDKVRNWIFESGAAEEVLKLSQPELRVEREYEQMSLFDGIM